MAINFLNDVGFNKNELIQPVLENQANDASAGTPTDGQLYYDTTNNVVKYGEGGSWIALATSSGTVTSVGLTETGNALTITNSPITGAGNINIAGAGSSSQYITGELNLATFPTIPTVSDATITLTMGDGLSSSSGSFTLNQSGNETFTFTVGEGTGITVASGSVGIDYAGTDNAILAASAGTPASADQLWFNDDTDDAIKRATIADIVALAPQGDVTAVQASTANNRKGIAIDSGTSGGPIPKVGLDIIGQTNLGTTPATGDELIIYDLNATTNKSITVGNLVAAAPQGTVTSIATTSPITGGTITGSGTISHAAQAQTNTTPSSSLSFGDTFTALSANVGVNGTGHVTGQTLTSFTLPSNPNTNTTYTLPTTNGNNPDIVLTGSDSTTDVVNMNGTSNTVTVTGSGTNTLTFDLADDVTITDSLTISGSAANALSIASGKAQTAATVASDPDATLTTKGYVDGLVTGGLTFKGTFRADSGLILSGDNSGSYIYNCPGGAGTRVAVAVGDYYVVATAGGSFYCSGDTLDIGDSIIGVTARAANQSLVTDWSIVQSDEGVVSFTNSNGGTYVAYGTVNTNATGAVTIGDVDLTAVDGTSTTSTKFLSKDNTWDVPSYTTNTDAKYELKANAKSGSNVPLFLDGSSGGSDSTVNLTQGTGITLTRNSATQITIDADNNGTVTSVGITDGYLMDTTGTNPITGSGSFTLDVDLSELNSMGDTLLTTDKAVILDVSETGKDQGKAITWAEVISDLNLATGSIPTVSNATITLTAGNFISGGGDFTLNQSGNETITFNVDEGTASAKGAVIVAGTNPISVAYSSGTATVSIANSAAAQKGAVIVAGGTGIDVSYSSGTATVSDTAGSTGAWSGNLDGSDSGIARAEAGGYTTFTLTTLTLFGVATNSRQCQVEVMQIADNDPSSSTPAYSTVYPSVARAAATTIEIKFKGSVANDKYYAVVSHAGTN